MPISQLSQLALRLEQFLLSIPQHLCKEVLFHLCHDAKGERAVDGDSSAGSHASLPFQAASAPLGVRAVQPNLEPLQAPLQAPSPPPTRPVSSQPTTSLASCFVTVTCI